MELNEIVIIQETILTHRVSQVHRVTVRTCKWLQLYILSFFIAKHFATTNQVQNCWDINFRLINFFPRLMLIFTSLA